MELLVKLENLTSYIYMNLRLATLKAVSFYLLQNVSTQNQCRKLYCGPVVCKHFASYKGYPNYRWDLIWYGKVKVQRWVYLSVFSCRECPVDCQIAIKLLYSEIIQCGVF
jgi:hypothetical protein